MTHAPVGSFFSDENVETNRRRSSNQSTRARVEPLQEVGNFRNRENLVVSNREIRELFERIKDLGDVVRRQNERLESMTQKMEETCQEVAEVKVQLQAVHGRDGHAAESRKMSTVGLFQHSLRFVQL